MPEKTRWDHHLKALREAYEIGVKHLRQSAKSMMLARGSLYDIAKHYLALQEIGHNEFVSWVSGQGMTVEQWADTVFGPFEAICENRRDIWAAIRSGVGRKEFMTGHSLIAIARRPFGVASQGKSRNLSEPPEPRATATPEEKAEAYRLRAMHWQNRFNELKEQYASLRKKLVDMERAVDQVAKQNRKLLRAV